MSFFRILLKETLFYSISKAIPSIFGIISILIFLRILGTDIYGQYSLILSQCSLIVGLGLGWFNQAILRYYTVDSVDSNYKYNQGKALFYSLLFSLIFFTIISYPQSFSAKLWLVSIITILTMGLYNFLKVFYQAKLLAHKIVFLSSLQSLFALILPITIMYFFGYNEIFLLFGIACSFFFAIIILLKNKTIKFFIHFNNDLLNKSNILIKKWFAYGLPLSFWFAAGLTLSFLDRFFINYYLSNNELGIYASLEEILTRSFSLTLFPITMALHPRIMKLWNNSKIREATELIKNSISIIFVIGILILLIVWLSNDFIFLVLEKLIPGFSIKSKILILPLLSAGFLWQLSLLTHKMLELKEQTTLMIIAIIPSLAINIIGNTYFLPILGGIATAYSAFFSSLAYFIITGLHCIYSIRRIKES